MKKDYKKAFNLISWLLDKCMVKLFRYLFGETSCMASLSAHHTEWLKSLQKENYNSFKTTN